MRKAGAPPSHVFADAGIASVAPQNAAWEAHKAAERRAAGMGD
jgi:hypothetical protein